MTLKSRVERVETDLDEVKALLGITARHLENVSAAADRHEIETADQRQDTQLIWQRLDRTDAQIQANAAAIAQTSQDLATTNQQLAQTTQRLDEYIVQNQRVLTSQGDRLSRVEAALESLVSLSQSHEQRLTGRESNLLGVEDRLDRIEANLAGFSEDMRSLSAAIDRLESILERHLSNHD
jgi:chromosome segregation ATPase